MAFSEQDLKKKLNDLGLKEYVKTSTKIVILSPVRGRSERQELLKKLQKLIPQSIYFDDLRSGFIKTIIDGKKVKLFLKPEKTASGIILKPQFFANITDIKINASNYFRIVKASIEENPKLDEQQKTYLTDLLEYHNTFSSGDLRKWKDSFKSSSDCISVNTINTDFGEVLGPLAILNLKLLPISKSEAKIFLPRAGNYPLLDYKIITNKKEYNISAKSGDTTNTLKPTDVKKLIDENKTLFTKYRSTTQYKVISILTENTWKQGPINALYFLKTRNYKAAKWIKNQKYTEEIRQKAENSIVEISRENLDFTPMFKDATSSKVYYVKFSLGNDGTPNWNLRQDQDAKSLEKVKKITFRSKNYVGRPNGDKLGFQV